MVPAFFLLLSFFSSIVDSLRSSRFSYGSHVITLYIALITVASFNHCFRVVFIGFRLDDGMAGEYRSLKTNIGLEKAVTLKQLKDATRNFGHENEIGRGGFGTVYKAELEGRTVAVKRLSSHSEERISEWKNEFYTLKLMDHQNIVQLMAVYNRKGLQMIIYAK
ncbi:putative protein kinase RLK-Pelle-DLSV family [Rosa chinensis]|uniref:Protein kinase domain-containing protein n=1 Tax=Rosa chinensis TaxID=74649 RepID=A0A2P6SD07_ROSCH|nr:putative protein kinase RLK-Pelle-DLSV family [Rosa chinensis]